MKIFENIKELDFPDLTDGRCYIYVLENAPQGNIKIGRSKHMNQRLISLSGSNSGGNQIVKCAVSDATYLYTLERILHMHFQEYRITGTEWFVNITFDDVVNYIDTIFDSKEYQHCNQVRKQFLEKHGQKYGEFFAKGSAIA